MPLALLLVAVAAPPPQLLLTPQRWPMGRSVHEGQAAGRAHALVLPAQILLAGAGPQRPVVRRHHAVAVVRREAGAAALRRKFRLRPQDGLLFCTRLEVKTDS